jgi:UDP-N-acetylmuramyl pentapeptide phosphotransferase/UDP-N-acetylglucosamine-1-phosphate transferase
VVVAVTAVINFLNFMDGLDGLVGLACVVVMAAAGVWPVAGALLGFLVWNWSPAKVFMGDVGSTWLGALLAGLVLQQSTAWGGISLLLVAFPLLADPLICLMRRLRAGQPIFQAHRLHLFQRLQGAGWSHAQVALLYGVGTLVMALGRLHSNHAPLMLLLALEFGAGLKLDRSFAVPFFQDAANKL